LRHTVTLTVALFATWLLWSGYWDVRLLVILGAVSCVLVMLYSLRLGLVDREGVPVQLAVRLLLYGPWLAWEVAKANWDVAKRILDPRLPIRPLVIRVKATQREDLGRVIYANSITLTPGTVSLSVEGDEIVVHALTPEAAAGVENGVMDRKVCWLEGRG